MAEVIFFLAAVGVIAGAIGTIALRNPFYSVLALVCHLISLAALFLLLRAEFVAAAQVVVYAGAVMVLYVFVVAYVGGSDEPLSSPGPGLRPAAALFAGALLVELCIAVLGTGLKALGTEGAAYAKIGADVDPEAGFGSPAAIGELLLTRFLLPFEAASLLLLVAAVGAVILARRRSGLELPGTLAVSDLTRSERSGVRSVSERGSLAEAAGIGVTEGTGRVDEPTRESSP